MKLIISLTLLLISLNSCAKEEAQNSLTDESTKAEYDSLYAKSVGADPYGMRKYVMVLIKTGTNKDLTEKEDQELLNAHIQNNNRLEKEGKLFLAGPFLKEEGDLRGVLILAVETIESAKEIMDSDPAVKGGKFDIELLPWYGTASLFSLNELHQKTQASSSSYDSLYAKKISADQYGFSKYVMAFLKKGPNRDRSEEEAKKLQAAHMANIGKMAKLGKLVLAGPFLNNGDIRGIYIFAVETIEEAKALTATDPAIKAGSLEMELIPWYATATLVELNALHPKAAKVSF